MLFRSQQVLHGIDPRLAVDTSYRDAATEYAVRALEPVSFKVSVPAPLAEEWRAGLRGLIDHGRDAKLPAAGVALTGSPLLERLFDGIEMRTAHISAEGAKRPAMQKIHLVSPDSLTREPFDDIHGQVSVGEKSMTFDGAACAGALSIRFKMPFDAPRERSAFTLALNMQVWDRRDVRRLPHLPKLARVIERLRSGWSVEIELEIEGLPVHRGAAAIPQGSNVLDSQLAALEYLSMLSKVAGRLGLDIPFAYGHEIMRDEFTHARDVEQVIDGRQALGKAQLNASPTMAIVACGTNVRDLLAGDRLEHFIVYIEEPSQLAAFGMSFALPRREVRLEGFHPRLANADQDLATIEEGATVSIVFEPSELFRCSFRYLGADEDSISAPAGDSRSPPHAEGAP